jgi:UTP--glucose-1-phosphate uridylyltransferase
MQKVKKLIIPVAGIGTRMLPVTKAIPKEMLPILDKPVIQYIVEEAVNSGITDIILVTGPTKKAIEDHFDRNEWLENFCIQSGKKDVAKMVKEISEIANFIYIRQKGPYGTGTPILNCRHLIGDEPFAVVWGDEIFVSPQDNSFLSQLIKVYEKYNNPVISAIHTNDEGTLKYAIAEGSEKEAGIYEVKNLIEKPGPTGTSSRIGSLGGYILTPEIFDILETMPVVAGRERYLTDAIDILTKKRPVYAKIIDAIHYDTGNKFNWLRTNIEMGLRDIEIGKRIEEYLKEKLN